MKKILVILGITCIGLFAFTGCCKECPNCPAYDVVVPVENFGMLGIEEGALNEENLQSAEDYAKEMQRQYEERNMF